MSGVVGVTITLLGMLVLDRRPVVTLHDVKIVPEYVRPGQLASIVWRATEHRNCAGEVQRTITDAANVRHVFKPEPTAYHEAMGETTRTFARSFRIPSGAAQGRAVHNAVILRWCNPIQEWWPMVERPLSAYFNVIAE